MLKVHDIRSAPVEKIRSLRRMTLAEVLQPRSLSPGLDGPEGRARGLGWLIPVAFASSYLAVRPLLADWLTVVQFFLFETAFVVAFAAMALWWVRPLLRIVIAVFEGLLRPVFPVQALLAGRHMRFTSQKLVFTVAGVTLVFSLLTAVHGVSLALKREIREWAGQALSPYAYFVRNEAGAFDEAAFQALLRRESIQFIRFSEALGSRGPGA